MEGGATGATATVAAGADRGVTGGEGVAGVAGLVAAAAGAAVVAQRTGRTEEREAEEDSRGGPVNPRAHPVAANVGVDVGVGGPLSSGAMVLRRGVGSEVRLCLDSEHCSAPAAVVLRECSCNLTGTLCMFNVTTCTRTVSNSSSSEHVHCRMS